MKYGGLHSTTYEVEIRRHYFSLTIDIRGIGIIIEAASVVCILNASGSTGRYDQLISEINRRRSALEHLVRK